jgi:ATP-binding cassette subfamily C protein CydC
LMRFFDPESGSITIDGCDLRDLPQDSLRQLVGFVSQDVYLFNASVRDNLRLGRPDASDSEIEAAATAALADEFIAALPDGYDSFLGERGALLSGGQRQRIAIARALVQDPPILIMDEPVSNLDTESEQDLRAAMGRLRSGRTTLVIAHRVSTIRSADTLVVLEHGHVARIGSYPDLVRDGLDPITLGLPAPDWPGE